MLTLHSPEVVHETVSRWKREHTIAVVPTMGCLHEGHLALIRRAQDLGDKVVASIFVNPRQFGPDEDFERYPRAFDADQALLEEAGVDLLFHPTPQEMYPPHFSNSVTVGKLADHLCGPSRPGHFDGVATVCLKLFQILHADFAVFGEKDFQQLRVLQQMVADFNLPLRIVPFPTVRETDGLAMSSRNRLLSPEERERAKRFPEALQVAKTAALQEGARVGDVLSLAMQASGEAIRWDYCTLVSDADLVPRHTSERIIMIPQPRLVAAAFVGKTRLIDNWAIPANGAEE